MTARTRRGNLEAIEKRTLGRKLDELLRHRAASPSDRKRSRSRRSRSKQASFELAYAEQRLVERVASEVADALREAFRARARGQLSYALSVNEVAEWMTAAPGSYVSLRDAVEKRAIELALARSNGIQTGAAPLLGMHRQAFVRRMARLGVPTR